MIWSTSICIPNAAAGVGPKSGAARRLPGCVAHGSRGRRGPLTKSLNFQEHPATTRFKGVDLPLPLESEQATRHLPISSPWQTPTVDASVVGVDDQERIFTHRLLVRTSHNACCGKREHGCFTTKMRLVVKHALLILNPCTALHRTAVDGWK